MSDSPLFIYYGFDSYDDVGVGIMSKTGVTEDLNDNDDIFQYKVKREIKHFGEIREDYEYAYEEILRVFRERVKTPIIDVDKIPVLIVTYYDREDPATYYGRIYLLYPIT